MTDKLCADYLIGLINKTTTNGQLRAVVELIDTLFSEDDDILKGDDWPKINAAFAAKLNRDKPSMGDGE